MDTEDQQLEHEDRFTFQLDRFKDGQPVETAQKILGGGIGHVWPDLVQDFLDFLRGCGYKIPDVIPTEVEEMDFARVSDEPAPKRRRKKA